MIVSSSLAGTLCDVKALFLTSIISWLLSLGPMFFKSAICNPQSAIQSMPYAGAKLPLTNNCLYDYIRQFGKAQANHFFNLEGVS